MPPLSLCVGSFVPGSPSFPGTGVVALPGCASLEEPPKKDPDGIC